MSELDQGLTTWQRSSNHNRMIELQKSPPEPAAGGAVELAFFGSSAFRITSPAGISVMIDPWRNHPSGKWDWYRGEFPEAVVDVGVSTHAHYDHDALHRLDAHVLLDRPIGSFNLADVTISGIADKHVNEAPAGSVYNWAFMYRELSGVETRPPNNPRQFDNTIVVVETGGLRIMHWGDNRPDPNDHVWDMLGQIDVAIMPIDSSIHLLTYDETDTICARLGVKVIVPSHYFIWDLMQRSSTLQPATDYVGAHDHIEVGGATHTLERQAIVDWRGKVLHFGDHVAFDKPPRVKGQDWG